MKKAKTDCFGYDQMRGTCNATNFQDCSRCPFFKKGLTGLTNCKKSTEKRTSTKSSKTTQTKRIPSEHEEQKALFDWAEVMAYKYPELNLMYHIPNEGKRSFAQANRLKSEGMKSGVPDIFLPVARKGYHGLFLEMKRTKGGQVSDAQKAWISALREQGYFVAVGHGCTEASELILIYLGGKP